MPTELETFTWIGAVLLGLCGAFQAVAVWCRAEDARGLSWAFLASWWVGELAMFAGMLPIASWHVLANYAINVVLISYMAAIKSSLQPLSGAEH